MKFLALTTLSLLGLVAAQDLSTLPPCATECALNGIGATGCEVTNSTCICSNQSFLSSVQTCISAPGACNETDIQATLAFANSFCGGIPSTNGTNATTTTSAPETSTTATESTESSESTESPSSETTSAEESSASETGSGASSSASVASETSGGFAAPTLAAFGVAQLLGVAGVVVAAL